MVVAKFASVVVWFPLLWRGARRAGWLSVLCIVQKKRLQCIAGLAPKIQTIKELRFMKCFKLNILNILMVETYFFKFSED